MNSINHIRVSSQIEANVAPSEVLEALKKQIFHLKSMYDAHTSDSTDPKLVKPEGVDEEDDVKDEVAKDGHDHQWLPANNNFMSDFIFY